MAEVIVIGAGIAGSLAAGALVDAGHEVVVLDKGFAVGGRIAARCVDGRRFDVGAQFLTAKSPTFQAMTAGWAQQGVVRTWFHGSPDRDTPADPDGHPRLRGTPTMRRIVEHVARGLEVRLGQVVGAVRPTPEGLAVDVTARPMTETTRPDRSPQNLEVRTTLRADAVLCTMPVPQTRAVLAAGGTTLSSDAEQRLAAAAYDPCLTVLAVPEGEVALPPRGAVRIPDGDVTWVTDHQHAGTSTHPAVTIHAGASFSRARFDADAGAVQRELVQLAAPLLGTTAEPVYLHRWRYATPTVDLGSSPLLERVGRGIVAAAGDAFGGGRVEGAALSGMRAAEAMVAALAEDDG